MKFSELKNKVIGKKLLTIISLDNKDNSIVDFVKMITKQEFDHNIDQLKLLLFEDKTALLFVDFDCDGYRSGDWNVVLLKELLDKGNTKEIKNINSDVTNLEYFKGVDSQTFVLITTKEYIIKMGQDDSDSYYPSNFFSVEECKRFVLGDSELIEFD